MWIRLAGNVSGVRLANGQTVERGELVEVDEETGNKALNSGYFLEESIFSLFEEQKYRTSLGGEHRQKILVVNGGGVGDCIIGLSAVATLRKLGHTVSYAVSPNALGFMPLFGEEPLSVIATNSGVFKNGFNTVLQMEGFLKQNDEKVRAGDYYTLAHRSIGISGEPPLPLLQIPRMSERSEAFLRGLRGKYLVGCHAVSSANHRNWYRDGWRELAQHLHCIDAHLIAFGTCGQGADISAADATSFSIAEQTAILSRCHAFVGIDSAWMHIAGLAGKSIVGLFGCSDPEDVAGRYSCAPVTSDVDCLTCRYLRPSSCQNGYSCMLSIYPHDVYKQVLTILQPLQKPSPVRKEHIAKSLPKKARDWSFLRSRPTLIGVFPYMWLGGGETATTNILKGLEPFFDVRIKSLNNFSNPILVNALRDRFDNVTLLDRIEPEDLAGDVVMWYGNDESIPIALTLLGESRPVSVRIVHTHYDEEGVDFHTKWGKVIDGAVCVSPVISRKIPGSVFVPNPVNPDRLEGEGKKHFKEGKTIGFLGRMDSNKRVDQLIKHLKELDCNLLVQGPPSGEFNAKGLKKLADDCGVGERVKFLPPKMEVGSFLRSVDALVLLSKSEGFPMVIAEAGWVGTPVISTEVGALPECFPKEIRYVRQDRGGVNWLEAKFHVRDVCHSDGIALKKKVEELCNPLHVSTQYRKYLRGLLGKGFPESFRKSGFDLIRLDGIGDVVASFALANRVREFFPEVRIKYTTRQKTLPLVELFGFEASTEMDRNLLPVQVEYAGCWEKKHHIIEGMGAHPLDFPFIKQKYTRSVSAQVGFFPFMDAGSKVKSKEWDGWEELSDILKKGGWVCGQLGHSSTPRLDFTEDWRSTDILGIFDRIQKIRWTICIEGLAMHLGYAISKPMIVLVGGSTREWVGSYPIHHHVVSPHTCQCFGALQDKLLKRDCKCECMKAITAQMVYDKFTEVTGGTIHNR